ncbi:DUF4267 domain-containing protein [Nocardioides bigeumensis]|jgi:hypothetical protein|uniref:Uncharacterized protein n=1 Tax=Nocardioides bigeumensis TaxID=433657 RepID=A0ABP5K3Y3_9ACTN
MAITFPASRAISLASAAYGVYALVRPEHLARAMEADPGEQEGYDNLARVYGVRDVTVSLLGILGPARGVQWAMRSRIASDLADCATLLTKADDGKIRGKAAAITVGWAALNFAAYRWDRARLTATG